MNDMKSRRSRKVAVLGPIPRDQVVTHAGERFEGFAVMVPRPSTLPMATTAFPTMTEEELPIGTVVSPDAFCSVAGRGPCRPASSRSSRPATGGRQILYFRTSRGVTTPDRRIALQPDRAVTIAPAAAAVPSVRSEASSGDEIATARPWPVI